MIGSLLFYALYPLSRYLSSRPSAEPSEKDPPSAVFDGKAVWDGAAVTVTTTRGVTQSQTTQLDPWKKGEAKERMKEPSPVKEDDTKRPDTGKDLPVPGLHGELQNEVSEVRPAALKQNEAQAENDQEEKVEVPTKEDGGKNIPNDVPRLKPDGSIFPADSPEEALVEQLYCLRLESSTQQTCPVQTKAEIPCLEMSLAPTEPIIIVHEPTCSAAETVQTAGTAESTTSAETPAEVAECWDEYTAPVTDETHGGESSSQFLLSCLLSNTETSLKLNGKQDAQAAWHFPTGPGLTEDVQCPLMQFPSASYYPQTEATDFEVMWRLWEEVDEMSATAAEPALIPFTKASMDFTIMSYNILADDLLEANQQLYTHCPLEVLDWSYRCSLILQEIIKWAPDILCLQEVQENHYHEQLYPVLSQMGYTCVYKRRTGTKTDGCATCFRSSCFTDVSVTELEFFRPETGVLDRHNVGLVLLLRPVVVQGSEVKAKGAPLCVANTHLLFNPRRGDVKLAQLAVLLAEVDHVVKSCKARGEHCNLILCGDFNSVPHMSLYQLITTGQLYFEGLPAWMISGQEDLSHRAHCHKLFAPLWPSCLGITDSCQYTSVTETVSESHSQKPGKCQFSHDFLLQLRFCPAACVRPRDLELIPGVTDNTPDVSEGNLPYEKSFKQTLSHRLELESVYKHVLPGSGNPEVTTLHAEGGATVDYIFFTPRLVLPAYHKGGGDFVREGLKLIGSLSLLSEDVLWSMRGLPNHIFPSDHLSLLAKFQLNVNAA